MAVNKFRFHFPPSVHLSVSADKQQTTRLSIQILVTGLQGALSEISANIPSNHWASRLQPLLFRFLGSQQAEGAWKAHKNAFHRQRWKTSARHSPSAIHGTPRAKSRRRLLRSREQRLTRLCLLLRN